MSAAAAPSLADLNSVLAGGAELSPAARLQQLVRSGMDRLPLPAEGATLQRWQVLSAVAAADLSLAKLFEGHTDAQAILCEVADLHDALDLLAPPDASVAPASPAHALWGVWAAEAPGARVEIHRNAGGQITLRGTKHWCSGAEHLTHALLTAWEPAPAPQTPQLVAVRLQQPHVSVSSQSWQAVGMAGSASVDVTFHNAPATLIGAPGDYLSRPGFWHGGAGVAACWYGGAMALARALHQAVAHSPVGQGGQPFKEAALGKVDVALGGAAALLREAAQWIDAYPRADAQPVVLRVRQAVEAVARQTLDETTRALGPMPLCRDAAFARRAADLPVFIRQSHADRDDAALGRLRAAERAAPWAL